MAWFLVELQPGSSSMKRTARRQINSILADRAPGITQAYVRIKQFIGNNPFLAYAVVNDGGAYLPARK